MTDHTPGPWEWKRVRGRRMRFYCQQLLKGPDVLCRFWDMRGITGERDALIIAAAPDLLLKR